MNYSESLEYIYNAKQAGAEKHGLANITELLKRLGNPEARFPSVHVAGTNGKGSVCSFADSILRAAGYKTGLFTSPYLERFTERIRFGGQEIPEDEFAVVATEVRRASDAMVLEGLTHPTFFELVTACGFLYFAEKKVDIAIIETGLGGRTDATNMIMPLVSVITTIGIDHAHALGGTIELIAGEKAGIIKPGVPCVLSGANDPAAVCVILQEAVRQGSKIIAGSDYNMEVVHDGPDGQRFNLAGKSKNMADLEIKLLGSHQVANAATAVLAMLELRNCGYTITDGDIRTGLAQARWPGRMEFLRREPPVLIDGAHNPQGADVLAVSVSKYLAGTPVCLVMGAMADKDAETMVAIMSRFAARVITTLPPTEERFRYSPEALAALFQSRGIPASACPDWSQAIKEAMASDMAVVVAGSLYLAGAVRTWFIKK